jgi:hypothetical protein
MNMSNLSAGVQILVTQMKENPDAFFGPITHDPREGYSAPRFHGWRQAIEEELIGLEVQRLQIKRPLPSTWFLNDEEKAALVEAYTEAKRQRFDAEIVYGLNRPAEELESTLVYKTANRYTTNLAQAMTQTKEAVASTLISGSAITSIGPVNTVGNYHGR